MKRFLLSIAFIGTVVYTASWFATSYLNSLQKSNVRLKTSWIINRNYDSCSVVVLGTSLPHAALNPRLFKQLTNLECANLGYGGLSGRDIYLLSELLTENSSFHPKYALIHTCPLTINNPDLLSIKLFLPYFDKSKVLQSELALYDQQLYTWYRLYPLSLRLRTNKIPFLENEFNDYSSIKPHYFKFDSLMGALEVPPGIGYKDKSFNSIHKRLFKIDSVTLNSNIKYLKKSIELLQSKGITVVLFSTPFIRKLHPLPYSFASLLKEDSTLLSKYQYLDFASDTSYTTTTQFFDPVHLNTDGSIKFTKDFCAKFIQQYKLN